MIGWAISRRAALAGLAATLASGCAGARMAAGRRASSGLRGPLGVQLYSVRDAFAADPLATIRRVRDIGYREVEMAGLGGRSPAELRRAMDRIGLRAPSAHYPLERLLQDGSALDEANALGCRFVVVPWIDEARRRTLDDWRKVCADLNRVGEAAKRAGLKLAYHNHDFEFRPVEGRTPFDLIRTETDPALVAFEIDVGWVAFAGLDPKQLFRDNPGRVPLSHFKDYSPERKMTTVGQGRVDFAGLAALRDVAGLQHIFVEDELKADPFGQIAAAYRHLRSLA